MLLAVVVFGLAAAWWLSQMIVVRTPIMDITPPEATVLVGAGVLLWAFGSGRLGLPAPSDRGPMAIGAGLFIWLLAAAIVRTEPSDVRAMLAFVGLAGGSSLVAYYASSRAPEAVARVILAFVSLALVAAFAGAVVERLTYPGPDEPDQLLALWSFFRPQVEVVDPRLGELSAPAIHFPSGDPTVPRVSSWFAHTNYLAFFGILTAPLAVAITLYGARVRSWPITAGGGSLLAMAVLMTLWTYSRVGIVGIAVAIALAVATEALLAFGRDRKDPASERSALRQLSSTLVPSIVVTGFAAIFLIGGSLGDGAIRARMGAITSAGGGTVEPGVSGSPNLIEESARRSTEIRLAMQRSAVEMILAHPDTLLQGPGMAAYETAIHSPSSPRYQPDAQGVRDPNSTWLSMGLAGGLPAILLLVVMLVWTWLRAARRVARETGPVRIILLWLAAWLPAWALAQAFGTFPFFAGEAVILWTMVGVGLGLTSSPDRADNP